MGRDGHRGSAFIESDLPEMFWATVFLDADGVIERLPLRKGAASRNPIRTPPTFAYNVVRLMDRGARKAGAVRISPGPEKRARHPAGQRGRLRGISADGSDSGEGGSKPDPSGRGAVRQDHIERLKVRDGARG